MVRKQVEEQKEKLTDLGKKAVDLGLGIVSITEKKVREVVGELINRGEIKKEEAEQFVDKIIKKTIDERKGLEQKLTGLVQKVIDKVPLVVTKKEIDDIKKRLSKLERK